MAQETTYLELSEDGDGAHKFYEVVVSGTDVTITYGRIGATGTVKTSAHPTEEKALATARKKISEKTRKGYAPAVRGVRQARAITRRSVASQRSTARQSPVLWRFASGGAAFGIFVDADRAWVGNQRGDVYTVSHAGEVTNRYKLPDGVKCIVADDQWIYAGCDDGQVYDLSGKAPFAAYEIAANVDIYWLDIRDGLLGVADAEGKVEAIDHEDEFQWSQKGDGKAGWMVRVDGDAIYHGHSRGVARYRDLDGRQVWHTPLGGQVLFGWQETDAVYAGASDNKVYRLAKADGEIQSRYQCDSTVFSCATAPDGKYVFAGDNHSSVYCFDASGKRLWKLGTGCGSALSMQYLDDRLYIVTTDGSLACLDVSEQAIHEAEQGNVPKARDIKIDAATRAVEPAVTLETAAPGDRGVVVECYQDGARLRVRVVESGYDSTKKVQFPKNIREAGARYLVESVRESERGFYRVHGDIKRLG